MSQDKLTPDEPKKSPVPGWYLDKGEGDEWIYAQAKYFEEYDEVFWRPIERKDMVRPQILDHADIKGVMEANYDAKVKREYDQWKDKAWRSGASEEDLD